MKKLRLLDYVSLSAYWFAISYLWNSIHPIVLPNLIAPPMVAESVKGSALGLLTSAGLLLAIFVQPVAGYLSDLSASRYGRRRPYIVLGTLLDIVFLLGIALATSYWFLFACYLLLQFASNLAHGPYQGLLPDIVPEERRGTASGAKQFAEIVGIIVTSLATAALMARGQTLLAIIAMLVVLIITMVITVLGVPEEPLQETRQLSWRQMIVNTFHVDPRRYPDYYWLLVSRLFILTGMNLVRNYVLYFVADVIIEPGLSSAERLAQANSLTGNLLAILAVAIAIAALPAGILCDRMSKRLLVFISGMMGAAGSLLMCLARGNALVSFAGVAVMDILIYGAIIGLSAGVFLSANWALATNLIPREEGGRYLGISNLATAGAGVIAGIGGPVRDFAGYTSLFVCAFISYVLGTLLLARIAEPASA